MQLGRILAFPRVAAQQLLHGRHLRIAEGIVLEVRQTPVRLGDPRIQRERRLVGGLAVAPPAQGLLHVADGHPHPHFPRLPARRLLVRLERLLLAQQPARRGRDRDPGFRVIRLDLGQALRGGVRFFEAPECQQCRHQPAPGEGGVRALGHGVTQQALGIFGLVDRQGERREPAQGGHVTGILLQDATKNGLRALAVIGQQQRAGLFDARAVRISEPRTLKGHTRVAVLSQVDERVPVRHPGTVMLRDLHQHPSYFLARPRRAPGTPQGARQVDTRVGKIRRRAQHALEDRDALLEPVLLEQRDAEQPQRIDLHGPLLCQHAQPALGGCRPPGAQRGVRLAQVLLEAGLGIGAVHDLIANRRPHPLKWRCAAVNRAADAAASLPESVTRGCRAGG